MVCQEPQNVSAEELKKKELSKLEASMKKADLEEEEELALKEDAIRQILEEFLA